MKNLMILMIIVVFTISGCSKATLTAESASLGIDKKGYAESYAASMESTDLFAYLSFWSGKIVPYKVTSGVFTQVNGGEGKVGLCQYRPAVDPGGKFLYITDNTNTITCFTIGEDGGLLKPNKLHPDIGVNQKLSECIIDPSGRYLYLAAAGRNENNQHGSRILQYNIQSDGNLQPMSPAYVETGTWTHFLVIPSSGKYLYVRGYGGIEGFFIPENGKLSPMPSEYTRNLPSICKDMAMSSDGSDLLLGEDLEEKLVWCSIDSNGAGKVVSEASIPTGLGIGGIDSIAIDSCENIAIITPSGWLTTYRMSDNALQETGSFMCLKDNRIMSKSNINEYMKGTIEYSQSFERLINEKSSTRERRSQLAARQKLCSQLQAVYAAPDGFVYISSTSGVYGFQSIKDGLVYSGPAITWSDTLSTIRNRSLQDDVRYDVQPVTNGMVFAVRK